MLRELLYTVKQRIMYGMTAMGAGQYGRFENLPIGLSFSK